MFLKYLEIKLIAKTLKKIGKSTRGIIFHFLKSKVNPCDKLLNICNPWDKLCQYLRNICRKFLEINPWWEKLFPTAKSDDPFMSGRSPMTL